MTVFPENQGSRIGLAQHCCSILVVPGRSVGWLGKYESLEEMTILIISVGLVLVDPPIKDTYLSIRGKRQVVIQTPSIPMFGGTEDFMPTAISFEQQPGLGARQSMFEELIYYWTTTRPADITPEKLTFKALFYYLLRIIAAKWISYLAVIYFSMRHCDTPPTYNTVSSKELDNIKSTLMSISSWPRRVASSKTSLSKCVSFIKHHGQVGVSSDSWNSLQEDCERLLLSLVDQGQQLEATVPVVATYLQLAKSRCAYLKTKNVSRLTVLALVFVPLSFVSNLFSMNEAFAPGGARSWLYFVVAFPVLIFVLLVAGLSMAGYSFPLSRFDKWGWRLSMKG
jgi:hypothetical protein